MSLPLRLLPLLKQFDDARDRLIKRLHGLTDAEYLWEPVADCWNVHPRAQCQTNMPFGKGEWVMDFHRPEPVPPPMTTIAWRMCHLTNGLLQRADYTTGTRSLSADDYEVASDAQTALSSLADATEIWRTVLVETTEIDLDQVGRSQLLWGLGPTLSFLDTVLVGQSRTP